MITQVTGLSSLNPQKGVEQKVANIISARVIKVIIDDQNPETAKAFKDFGGWSTIGCIFFTSLNEPNPNVEFTSNNFALPLFPNVSAVPLKNEIVYIMSMPNSNIQSDVNETTYYYFQSINIWGSAHHNAIPDPINGNSNPESQRQDYIETEIGNVRRVTDGGTEIFDDDYRGTFQEKLEIRNMLPYEGDYIYQGRWGNTIRLGSTVTDAAIPNTWSSTGENGDPIMILKNGQHDEDKDPWIPQVEDINTDLSSIYLTSTQALPIDVASKKYDSYFNPPTSTKEFDSEQVVINSGRILFNSKNDNILLSSFDTINLNSLNSLNIDTPKTVIQSKEIYLGDKYATEPIILGDTFLADFQILLNKINELSSALMVPMSLYPPVGANSPLPLIATSVKGQCGKMIGRINKYKSKVSKSK